MTADPSKRALVIDDDDHIRELLRTILEWRGFAVDVMCDGIGAVDLTQPYDVILLDLQMPVFDGERLTDYWQLTDPSILDRVIVVSGYSRFTRGRKLPTFATLAKPFEPLELIRLVDACVNRPETGYKPESAR